MKKIKLSVLTAFMMSSMFYASSVMAQSNPCGWTLLNQTTQPSCDKLCNGSIIVTPDIVLPNVVYAWSNGSASSQQYNLCSGVYTVTVTDDKKCAQTFTYTLADPSPVTISCISAIDESYCGAGDGSVEALASGGDGSYTYEWQTNPIQFGAALNNLVAGTYTVLVSDGKDCSATTSCTIYCKKKNDCDGFRTQTQGGWGQCQQNGNNPGSYLFSNFAGAFPNGLIIGCTNTLELTSAQAVCDFLPSGTTPTFLPAGNMTNPGAAYKNVFAGQLVAATLNVGFDMYDANFGAAGVNLGDLLIASGPFTGWTVNDLLEEANNKIGGCASSYSYSKLAGALGSINENFVDGAVDNGFLVCPDQKIQKLDPVFTEQLSVSVYPNPVKGAAKISVTPAKDEVIQVDVYSVTGQIAASLFKGEVQAQESFDLNLDAESLETGIYFVKVISSDKVLTHKFIVKN